MIFCKRIAIRHVVNGQPLQKQKRSTSLLLLLLLKLHYSPMWTSDSFMHYSKYALFFYLSFQFVILHLLILVRTQLHLFFGGPLSRLPWGLLLNTWFILLLLPILLRWPIQFTRLILTNENISKSPNSRINSLLYRFLQFSFNLILSNILLKMFLSKAASQLAITLFSVAMPLPGW